MKPEYFSDAMDMINSMFRRGYDAKAAASIWDAVRDEPDAAMVRAVKRIEMEFHPDQLVAPGKIRDIILQEGRKIRDREAEGRQREADRLKAEEAQPWKTPVSVYGRAVVDFLSCDAMRDRDVEALRNTAEGCMKRFPGRGFEVWVTGALNRGKGPIMDRQQQAAGECSQKTARH